MTYGDRKFMMEVGIEPCTLYDPFPGSIPPPPGPGFVPPKSVRDSLGEQWSHVHFKDWRPNGQPHRRAAA